MAADSPWPWISWSPIKKVQSLPSGVNRYKKMIRLFIPIHGEQNQMFENVPRGFCEQFLIATKKKIKIRNVVLHLFFKKGRSRDGVREGDISCFEKNWVKQKCVGHHKGAHDSFCLAHREELVVIVPEFRLGTNTKLRLMRMSSHHPSRSLIPYTN